MDGFVVLFARVYCDGGFGVEDTQVRLIPRSLFFESELYHRLNQTDWLTAGQLLYGGLIAIGTCFVALGEAVVDWGMKLVGTYQAALGEIQQAVERAGAILIELANFVIQQIQALFASIHAQLRALWDASGGAYLGGIEVAFSLAIAEFEITGGISPSTASRLVAAFTAPMFWAFLGVAVAVVAAYVVYAVSTLGLGFLLASVGATIAASLAWPVFGLSVVDFAIGVLFDPGATIGQLIGPFLSWFASASWIDPGLESLWNVVLGALFATGSLMANAVAYAASDQSGSSATVWGLSLGIFSLVLSFGTAVGGAVGKAFAIVGGFFGFLGAFFSFVGGLKVLGLYRVVNLAGTAMGGAGAYLGIQHGLSG